MSTITKLYDVIVGSYHAAVVTSYEPLTLEQFGNFIKKGIVIDDVAYSIAQIETFPIKYPYPARVQFVVIFKQ